jgi:hypothetical protein
MSYKILLSRANSGYICLACDFLSLAPLYGGVSDCSFVSSFSSSYRIFIGLCTYYDEYLPSTYWTHVG